MLKKVDFFKKRLKDFVLIKIVIRNSLKSKMLFKRFKHIVKNKC